MKLKPESQKLFFLIIVTVAICALFFTIKHHGVDEKAAKVAEKELKLTPDVPKTAKPLSPTILQKRDAYSHRGEWIKIIKLDHKLHVMKDKNIVKIYDIAVGKNLGQKVRAGDCKTPVGDFSVQQIQSASHWSHDFKDGKGVIQNAYGPWFIRLRTGWNGIGIHGTHAPNSIGTNDTEGCIRLKNSDVDELKRRNIRIGMPVVIVE